MLTTTNNQAVPYLFHDKSLFSYIHFIWEGSMSLCILEGIVAWTPAE